MNIWVFFVAALVPMVIGAIWYNPKVLGSIWMKEASMTTEQIEGANMLKIFAATYFLSLLLSFMTYYLVVHQAHVFSSVANQPGFGDADSELGQWLNVYMENYGQNFRTFKHGLLHGAISGLFIAIPVLGVNALFERKSFRYILLNGGFWTLSISLMGGLICWLM